MADPSHKELQAFIEVASRARRLFPRSGIGKIEGVSGAQLEVLVAVAAYPGASTAELGDRLGIHPTGVTRALNMLNEEGFVSTERHGTRSAWLTAKGEEALAIFLKEARKISS